MLKNTKNVFILLVSLFSVLIIAGTAYASSNDNHITEIRNTNNYHMDSGASYNQTIAEINGVYYVSYVDQIDKSTYNGYLHIIKSSDGGHTWTDLYSVGNHTAYQPAILAADNNNRLHVIWGDVDGTARYMRFSGNPLTLDMDTTIAGYNGAKFSAVYSPASDVLYYSRREGDGNLHVLTLNTLGQVIRNVNVVNHVGVYGTTEYWDTHYHSLYADANGRLHLIYTAYWYAIDIGTNGSHFNNDKVIYLYSDDQGVTWKKANNSTISIPFATNDYVNGGTPISTESKAWGANIIADLKYVYILYYPYTGYGEMFVRINRSTGNMEKRYQLPAVGMHSTLVADWNDNKIYIVGETEAGVAPTLLVSENFGDTWAIASQIDSPSFTDGSYFYATALQKVTKDGTVIGMTMNTDYTGKIENKLNFIKFRVKGAKNYRFEKTVSGSTPANGASLTLDGTGQIKDSSDLPRHGNATSYNGTDYGLYKTSASGVTPVPYTQIRGATANNVFINLNHTGSNDQGLNLGDIDPGTGLTLEGWFYPTGTQADADNNGRLISKRGNWLNGSYELRLRSDGSVSFSVQDAGGYRDFKIAANKVTWNAWNYIAVTWSKNSQDADFYIKQLNGSVYHETVHNASVSGFSDNDEPVRIGYSGLAGQGFQGYMDEIRISNSNKSQSQLMVSDVTHYYRLEATASGTTAVTDGASFGLDGKLQIKDESNYPSHGNPESKDSIYYRFESTASGATQVTEGASLRLDGTSQVKDQSNYLRHGNATSYNGTNYGIYKTSASGITPVPYTQIGGAMTNNAFINLNHTVSNDQGLNLGDFDLGTGLTLEGWFYPTGTQADADNNGRLISKRSNWLNGSYELRLRSDGSVSFSVQDAGGYRDFKIAANKVTWNAWNYVAVTWTKNSQDADFYIKQLNGSVYHETIHNASVSGFSDNDEPVRIGYYGVFGQGFQGYMDEVRISNYKLEEDQLLLSNSTTFGTYESSSGGVSPVPYTEIRGAASNNFFGKLNADNVERLNLGDLDMADGLTLEGWFYPLGSQADADTTGRLLEKTGVYDLKLNANGGITFYMFDKSHNKKIWVSSNNKVTWNQWNYISVTWQKGSNTVDVYIKQPGGTIFHESITNTAAQDEVDTGNSPVLIGRGWEDVSPYGGSYTGFFDEVRISGFKRNQDQLLVQ